MKISEGFMNIKFSQPLSSLPIVFLFVDQFSYAVDAFTIITYHW